MSSKTKVQDINAAAKTRAEEEKLAPASLTHDELLIQDAPEEFVVAKPDSSTPQL